MPVGYVTVHGPEARRSRKVGALVRTWTSEVSAAVIVPVPLFAVAVAVEVTSASATPLTWSETVQV